MINHWQMIIDKCLTYPLFYYQKYFFSFKISVVSRRQVEPSN